METKLPKFVLDVIRDGTFGVFDESGNELFTTYEGSDLNDFVRTVVSELSVRFGTIDFQVPDGMSLWLSVGNPSHSESTIRWAGVK